MPFLPLQSVANPWASALPAFTRNDAGLKGTQSTKVNRMTAVEKDQVLGLLERLDGTQRTAAVSFIQFLLLDPVARAVAMAPPDDEPVTDEDRRRFHEGQAWFDQRGGKGIPMDDVLSEFGFRPEDFIVNQ